MAMTVEKRTQKYLIIDMVECASKDNRVRLQGEETISFAYQDAEESEKAYLSLKAQRKDFDGIGVSRLGTPEMNIFYIVVAGKPEQLVKAEEMIDPKGTKLTVPKEVEDAILSRRYAFAQEARLAGSQLLDRSGHYGHEYYLKQDGTVTKDSTDSTVVHVPDAGLETK